MGKLYQSRSADTLALGIFEEKTLELPRAGAPEVMANRDYGLSGCSGSCGCNGACSGGVGDVLDTVKNLSTGAKVAGALALYFAYKKLWKRR